MPEVLREAATAVLNGASFDDVAEDLAESQGASIDAAYDALSAAFGELSCGHEIFDGSADPSYAYCGLPDNHGGEHGNWQK